MSRNFKAKRRRELKKKRVIQLMQLYALSLCEAENAAKIELRLRKIRFLESMKKSKSVDRYNTPSILNGAQSIESVDTCARSLQPAMILKDQYGEVEVYR